jgi:hypothetical protein
VTKEFFPVEIRDELSFCRFKFHVTGQYSVYLFSLQVSFSGAH